MTQPTKREQLAAMRLEDFKAHLRTITGGDAKAEMTGSARPNPLLVRNRKKTALDLPETGKSKQPKRAPKRRRR
jgi:hypothetical protein